jgi:hypothetical protein
VVNPGREKRPPGAAGKIPRPRETAKIIGFGNHYGIKPRAAGLAKAMLHGTNTKGKASERLNFGTVR